MAATGELVQLLAKALRRARMGANDRGALSRLRGAGESFLDDPRPGYVRSDVYPERFNNVGASEPTHYARHSGVSENSNNDAWEDLIYPASGGRPISDDDAVFFMGDDNMLRVRMGSPRERAASRWSVDNPVAKSLLIGGAGLGGGALTLREALRNQWSA